MNVHGDLLDEADETFTVGLANALNATISDASGLGTIVDNDPLPSLSVNDVTVTEGDSGTVNATFTVALTPVSGRQVTVQFATADGSAHAPGDYAAASGTLTFAAGETIKTVNVAVNGDLLDEVDETFTLNLSSPGSATIGDAQGAGTITDDDGTPSLSVNDVTVTEGNGSSVNAVFTVSLSSASGQPVSVDYATADGTAIAGADYVAATGNLVFNPGQTSRPITVTVSGDALDEIDETFTLALTNATNATIADGLALGTIMDNDPLPTVSVNDVTVAEGDTGTVVATFTVSLNAPSGRDGLGRLRDRRQHGDHAGRLRGSARNSQLRRPARRRRRST